MNASPKTDHQWDVVIVGGALSGAATAILLLQEFNESIPALLPGTVRVAHKTGWTGDVHHDTGIIYPEKREPYALTIMTRGWIEEQDREAYFCMARISRMIYERLL